MRQPEIVRHGELIPCHSAFIDAHTPGSNSKENFTIIGSGVSESADQHVHIKATPGFNIGAAGQPPKCVNSLHYHNTAEVFFVLKGRWRFFWGSNGADGEVILEEGDIFNIPTRIFRGFENVGNDYGMIMAILGGDDAGGGVIWAPQVLDAATEHGLVLGESGKLYDTKKGQQLPTNEQPVRKISSADIAALPRVTAHEVVHKYVARYWDMMALANTVPCEVISEQGLIQDKPGFNVEFLSRSSLKKGSLGSATQCNERDQVLMVMRGHWQLLWHEQNGTQTEVVLNPGDTCWLPPNTNYTLSPAMMGEASIFRVTRTSDSAGLTWTGD